MGFSVQYGPDGSFEREWKRKLQKKRRKGFGIAAIIVLLSAVLFLQKRQNLDELLIPGNPEVTKAAYMQFSEDLREGDSFREAITTFCQEIFTGATLE